LHVLDIVAHGTALIPPEGPPIQCSPAKRLKLVSLQRPRSSELVPASVTGL
jgi:hypothetical protein